MPRIIEYLGYDPFTNPELGRPKGNESTAVAFLSPGDPVCIDAALHKRSLELRTNKKEFTQELGVEVKTLRDWEAGRHVPLPSLRQRIQQLLKL